MHCDSGHRDWSLHYDYNEDNISCYEGYGEDAVKAADDNDEDDGDGVENEMTSPAFSDATNDVSPE